MSLSLYPLPFLVCFLSLCVVGLFFFFLFQAFFLFLRVTHRGESFFFSSLVLRFFFSPLFLPSLHKFLFLCLCLFSLVLDFLFSFLFFLCPVSFLSLSFLYFLSSLSSLSFAFPFLFSLSFLSFLSFLFSISFLLFPSFPSLSLLHPLPHPHPHPRPRPRPRPLPLPLPLPLLLHFVHHSLSLPPLLDPPSSFFFLGFCGP